MAMKRLFLFVILIGAVVLTGMAQNRSIRFEQNKEWKKVVKKAKKEKKIVFVDCYTSWCGPCKQLANKVFTLDSVADYFNRHFINVKYDMEKDTEGVMLKKEFTVQAYPTLLFIDPQNLQMVHRLVGAGSPEWLLKGARLASDPENGLTALTRRYENGERDIEFLKQYLEVLSSAYMAKEQMAVATDYLNSLPEEQLVSEENWNLIYKNVSDPLSKPLRYVMANKYKFYQVAGQDAVDYKLKSCMMDAVLALVARQKDLPQEFSAKEAEMREYLHSIDDPMAPVGLAYLYTAAYARKKDYAGLLDQMQEAMKYNLFRDRGERTYFQTYIEMLKDCEDKELVKKGILWIDKRCEAINDYFEKADLMNSKARLQKSIGDTTGAERSMQEEKRYTHEGEQKAGGRVVRAIRMN